jgi:hypothetical protein
VASIEQTPKYFSNILLKDNFISHLVRQERSVKYHPLLPFVSLSSIFCPRGLWKPTTSCLKVHIEGTNVGTIHVIPKYNTVSRSGVCWYLLLADQDSFITRSARARCFNINVGTVV